MAPEFSFKLWKTVRNCKMLSRGKRLVAMANDNASKQHGMMISTSTVTSIKICKLSTCWCPESRGFTPPTAMHWGSDWHKGTEGTKRGRRWLGRWVVWPPFLRQLKGQNGRPIYDRTAPSLQTPYNDDDDHYEAWSWLHQNRLQIIFFFISATGDVVSWDCVSKSKHAETLNIETM
jgi:hypothetical protein